VKKLSGHTKPYAVLGHPIGHTLSPVMHNASMESLGLDAIYLAFDVHPDRLISVLASMRDMGFGGVNLTVPLKEIAFQHLTDLDESARIMGAVNTVSFHDENMRGHNTDGYGFVQAVNEAFGPSIKQEHLFVLGTGGAGRAVALTCAGQGAASLTLSDLDLDRCERVADEIRRVAPALPVSIVTGSDATQAARTADIIIQSTPVGMKKDDPSLLPPEAFRTGQKVYDLIYMYPETALLKIARDRGAQVANGLGMLLHQGARAFTIWTGLEPDTEAMRQALEHAVYGHA